MMIGGVVVELPTTSSGKESLNSAKLAGQPVNFFCLLPCRDEGHRQGEVFHSNPHHVFEVIQRVSFMNCREWDYSEPHAHGLAIATVN